MGRSKYYRLSPAMIDSIVRLYKEGVPANQIAIDLRLDEATIHKYLTVTGTREVSERVSAMAGKRLDDKIEKEMVELYKSGMPIKDLSKQLDLSFDTIYRHIAKHGLTRTRSKQVYLDAIEQVDMYGRNVNEVAEEFGISPSTIYRQRKKLREKGSL